MNVALVGSSGYIARFLLRRFSKERSIKKVIKIDQTDDADAKLDLRRADDFHYDILDDIDLVIFVAAISSPDKCASDFDFAWSINVTGTCYFITKALTKECKVLFFSSDSVFGDVPGMIYTEDSETNAFTPYGKMKKTVEDEFKNRKGFKAIRLSYVVSSADRFVSYCLDCIKNNSVAEVYHPFYRNCVVVSDVVTVVLWFIKHWDRFNSFALNVCGDELISRVRISDEINRIKNNQLAYKVLMPGADFYKNRPMITQMKSLYLKKYRILKTESFTAKIQKELTNIGG